MQSAQPIAFDLAQITSKANGSRAEPGLPTGTLAKGSSMHVAVGTDLYNGAITGDVAATMTNRTDGTGTGPTVMQAMAFDWQSGGDARGLDPKPTAQLQRSQTPAVMQSMAVRRLTPVECERLQGFPDNYTDIQPKGKATPDGPRYKALGNSMAVPVMRWIGERIAQVEGIA